QRILVRGVNRARLGRPGKRDWRMSYRAFKRLLGETSLERKCRFLFGGVILLLIAGSFYWYARQTEDLAYEQTRITGRLLVKPVVAQLKCTALRMEKKQQELLNEFQSQVERHWPEALQNYQYGLIRPNARDPGNQPRDYERLLLKEFMSDDQKYEESRDLPTGYYYYAAIRATKSC